MSGEPGAEKKIAYTGDRSELQTAGKYQSTGERHDSTRATVNGRKKILRAGRSGKRTKKRAKTKERITVPKRKKKRKKGEKKKMMGKQKIRNATGEKNMDKKKQTNQEGKKKKTTKEQETDTTKKEEGEKRKILF